MSPSRTLLAITALTILSACASSPPQQPAYDHTRDGGILWVKHAAEYHAITRQVYAKATSDLPAFVEDTSWSAMPEQSDAAHLPPAVILDVDETVVSNVDFQLTFERPFANHKLDTWSSGYDSRIISGVKEFVEAARAVGVTVFYVTNRPCEPIDGVDDPCPQKGTTIDDIREVGIEVSPEFVMLSGEQPGWDREKLVRRNFVPCARAKVVAPCTAPGTRASRLEALDKYNDFWGNGWYILPNPMHGSWTSVR